MTKQPTPFQRKSDQRPLDGIEASLLHLWVLITFTVSPAAEAFYKRTPQEAQEILSQIKITLSTDHILEIIKR